MAAGLRPLRHDDIRPDRDRLASRLDVLDLADQRAAGRLDGRGVRSDVAKREQESGGVVAQREVNHLAVGVPGDKPNAPGALGTGADQLKLGPQPGRVTVAAANQAKSTGV